MLRNGRPSDTASNHNAYVWIRVDAVDAIWNNHGVLPQHWKASPPRKRGRNESSVAGACFDWVRAVVAQSSPISTLPSGRQSASRSILATLTVQDREFAPPHLRNATVSLSYDPSDLVNPLVCDANTWWNTRDKIPPEDLTTLTHLHEPSVVYCLKERYRNDSIYTYTGKILLALNPFRSIKGFYGEAVMEKYWQPNQPQRPPPHVYVIAQDAYQNMLDSRRETRNADQSILVSGESGSGKSVTTKIVMGYLAAQSQRNSDRNTGDPHRQGIESQLLQSNPILESFGNARTVRNDNSSRFGKFMELLFTASGTLASASIETYLLEKVRIISQAPGERNYHIFYEILAGLPQRDRQTLRIGNVSARDFRMTASSGTYDRRDGVDDRETYQHLRKALDTVGFVEEEQRDMIGVACALLHTSNIEFAARSTPSGEEGSMVVESNALQSALELLGVPLEALASALCVCIIEARGEVFRKNLTVSQSIQACEALIKATYGALFAHIVKKINLSIAAHLNSDQEVEQYSRIGVLDIFGFESFPVNSFEQLCINYCNEALQQQFNRFVFKLEQEEYDREGIDWAFISFPDNQDVLDLIEKRREGILAILDDQCRVVTCTDASFCRTVHDKCKDHPRFLASMTQRSGLSFTVHHYAGPVTYEARFFLEKNKDELPKETTELLAASSLPFISYLGDILCEKPDADASQRPGSPCSTVSSYSSVRNGVSPKGNKQFTRGSSSLHRESVGSQFSHQLKELRRRIDTTTPHYIRCLKPNDDLVPDRFDPHVIADQLRCAGVLEVIRVSRVGFPNRYCHEAFIYRYGIITPCRGIGQSSATSRCSAVVRDLIPLVTVALQEQDDAVTHVDYQQ
jgi:myosin V